MSATSASRDGKLARSGVTGVVLGVGALLACELPLILAFVGLGSLGAAAGAFRPPLWAEAIAVVAMGIGLLMLAVLGVRCWQSRANLGAR